MQRNPLKEIFRHLHRYFNKNTPLFRGIYAIEKGKYIGEFFVFVKTLKTGDYAFLSLPKMSKRIVPVDSFNNGVKDKIMVFVERLPPAIYALCCKQFDKSVDNVLPSNK